MNEITDMRIFSELDRVVFIDRHVFEEAQGCFSPDVLVSDVFGFQMIERRSGDEYWTVTTTYYGVVSSDLNDSSDPETWYMECATETTTCTDPSDPGGSEINSDYDYEPVDTMNLSRAGVQRCAESDLNLQLSLLELY